MIRTGIPIMESVFEYTDFRKLLRDYYTAKKNEDKKYTYRYIAEKVGFKSAGHFTQIITGKINISYNLIERFALDMKLKKREKEYFQNMVLYNQAKYHGDKKRYFKKIASFKESPITFLNKRQYEFYDKWYYSAIREALDFIKCDGSNCSKLAKILNPGITIKEAKNALILLETLGIIKKDSDGFYIKTDQVISTGYIAKNVSLNNYVLNSMKLAAEAVDRFPKEKRNLSWMTLSLSEESFGAIQEELRAFRKKALAIALNDKQVDRVCQFNFQIFPMTKLPQGDK